MGSLVQSVREKGLSRRTFIAGSALAAMSLALQGCGDNNLQSTTNTKPITEGEWIPVECWNHCGGKCALKAYVADGICIRLKTDDTHEDSVMNPQRRACARGRARRQDAFGSQRMKYPMKRKSWQPGGGEPHPALMRRRWRWPGGGRGT